MQNSLEKFMDMFVKSKSSIAAFVSVLVLSFLAGTTPSVAATLIWTNSSGTFSSASNWDPAQAPASGDDTTFTNNTSYTVSFSGNALDFATQTFSGQTGVVTLDMGSST